MVNETQKVQRRIQLYAILMVILVAIIVSLVAIVPLYLKLRTSEMQTLLYTRNTSVLVLNQYISHLENIAKQISSRTKAMYLTLDYTEGRKTRTVVAAGLHEIMASALQQSSHLVGMRRYDCKDHVIMSIGQEDDNTGMAYHSCKKHRMQVYGPIKSGGKDLMLITSPVFYQQKQIAVDVITFATENLQKLIFKEISNNLGLMVIGKLENGQINQITADGPQGEIFDIGEKSRKQLGDFLKNAILYKAASTITIANPGEQALAISYAPIKKVEWAIAFIVKKDTLMASIQETVAYLSLAILLVILLFVMLLRITLKPLTGSLIIHEKELEKKVSQGQKALSDANAQLQHLVSHDALTDVANRRGFEQAFARELARAKRSKTKFTLLYIDVDKFKQINDTYGHEAGDRVLETLAKKLKAITRAEDIVARLGGDEFALIMPGMVKKDVGTVINAVYEVVSAAAAYQDKLIRFQISAGAACFPEDGETIEALVKVADEAMYTDKRSKQHGN